MQNPNHHANQTEGKKEDKNKRHLLRFLVELFLQIVDLCGQ